MINIKIASLSLISNLFVISAAALQNTYIVCASKNDRSNWYWALNNREYIKVTGYHLYGRCGDTFLNRFIIPRNSQLLFFVLDRQSVHLAKSACPSDFYFQPAESITDIWYRFAEGENNGITKTFDGHIKCLTDLNSKL
ncbi:MAG: hypothetical protein K2X69_08330 [Silvanigrellaceae bacterium]|nr:hypothetical protein [Silvanigrellaceae bacterium]